MLNKPADASRYQHRGLMTTMGSLGRLSEKHGSMVQQRRSVGQVFIADKGFQAAANTVDPIRSDMRREAIHVNGSGGLPVFRDNGLKTRPETKVIDFIPTTNKL